ncbi:MAG: VWA domain-containing protein [Desulfobacterales bacterium]|nr:VWA domain-containing protein [Desulfobacterales bacterium]MDD4071414.1 VWA domain-containing protein [Desulfobacterales bacterium]MDD4391459.1 VWA domain-containing protein [Desulfobacterales bacterium]
MISKKDIMRSLPLLANALGKSYGIKVEIGGNEAFTNGSTIRLPSLPVEGDTAFLGLVRGYIDHEAAHIRHTDFDCLKQANTPLEKHVWNILEDRRVENKLTELFPGCRQNFNWLIRHLFLTNNQETQYKNPATKILDWLLLTVRSWDVRQLRPTAQGLAFEIDATWPGLRNDMKLTLLKARAFCPDSTACLIYAREIISLINAMTHRPCSQTNQNADDQPKEVNSQNENGEARSDENSSDSLQPAQQQDDEEEDEIADSISNQEYSTDGKKDIPQARSIRSLKNLLNASDADLPKDFGTTLAESLENIAEQEYSQLQVASIGHKKCGPFDAEAMENVRKSTSGIRARFHGLMQSTKLTRASPSRKGKLYARNLHRVVIGNPRIFLNQAEKQDLNTAVHILMDCSGSMYGCINLAGQVCQVVATALFSVGVNVGVTAFPGDNEDGLSDNTVAPIVEHGKKIHSRFNLSAAGTTPMGESLWWVLQQMVLLRENRKIILIITDGSPDSMKNTRQAISAGKNLGIEFHGLGINSHEICYLLPESSQNIKELSELGPATFKLFGKVLSR